MPERQDAAAVGKRLVNREVKPIVSLLHPRPVERARAALRADAAALRALPGGAVRALLEEQELDAAVGRGFEGVRPPGRGSPTASRFLAPALHRLSLLSRVPILEHRL